MRGPTLVAILLPAVLGCAGQSLAAGGLSVVPAWEAQPAQQFTTDAGALCADGRPFPILYEFTWSAPHDADFFRYFSQFLGTSHWESFSLNLDADFSRETIDRVYEAAAGERIYVTLSPSVQHCAYSDAESFAVTADGERNPRGTRSFLHEGYRQALAAKLAELAQYVRDKPYHMGWYPQDEYAYRAFSGFEECSLAVFRERMIEKHGSLEALNQAWGTNYQAAEDIDPPHEFERSVRFADWQEFRRWAQTDFTRFVYQTLKEADPEGSVIWSLPFWGSWTDAAGWWDMAGYSDVLMRHGIGYATGIYRLALLRAVSAWSGKPANALCMPPDYNPTYVQMGFLFEGPPTGLSHVCAGGAAEHTYYQGAADSENGYKRKEPMYTGSRSLNDLVRYLGATFLQAKHPPAKVGVFVSDRTVLVNGTDLNRLNGILLLLSDLNADYEVFAEPSLGDLSRFDAIFAGQYSQCSSPEITEQFAAFARSGGLLVLSTGAFSADWYNRPLEANPGSALAGLVGSEETEQRQLAEPLEVVARGGELVVKAFGAKQGADLPEQLGPADGLGEESIGSHSQRSRLVFEVVGPGGDEHGDVALGGIAQLGGDVADASVGEEGIENDERGAVLLHRREHGVPGVGLPDLVAGVFEDVADTRADTGAIVRDQDTGGGEGQLLEPVGEGLLLGLHLRLACGGLPHTPPIRTDRTCLASGSGGGVADRDQGDELLAVDAKGLTDVFGEVVGPGDPAGAQSSLVGGQQQVLDGRGHGGQGEGFVAPDQLHVGGDDDRRATQRLNQGPGVVDGPPGGAVFQSLPEVVKAGPDHFVDQPLLVGSCNDDEVAGLLLRADRPGEGRAEQVLDGLLVYGFVAEPADRPASEERLADFHSARPPDRAAPVSRSGRPLRSCGRAWPRGCGLGWGSNRAWRCLLPEG